MTPNEAGVADGFVCPITCLTMVDPVMLTGDGHTYERYAIEQWLRRGNRTSPLAGSDLGSNVQLVPNHAVRKAIAELKVELPSKSDIEEACGHKAADILDKDEPGPSKTARVYNEDETYIFASLRRSLYSLDATVCVWKAKQLCLSKANSCTSVDSTWPNTMKAQITCMKACGRSRAIVSGSRDNILRVWELPSSVEETASPAHLREVAALQCHSDWINCLDVNCAEEVVVTGGRDSRIRVWDTLKWTCNHTLRTDDYVNCLAFDRVKDGFFVSGGNDWKLLVWDSKTMQQSHEFSGHTYAIKCCAVDPVSASWILSSGDDSKLCVWSTKSKNCEVEIEGAGGDYNESINCCAISSDGRTVACGLANHRLALWDTRMWKLLQNLDGHKAGVEDLCFVRGFGDKKLVSVDGRSLKTWSCSSNDWSCQHTVSANAIACCEMSTLV